MHTWVGGGVFTPVCLDYGQEMGWGSPVEGGDMFSPEVVLGFISVLPAQTTIQL